MWPIPPDEPGRLEALKALNILDTAPEEIYDDVVTLAASICEVPIAVINFIDHDRQWGKALVGLDGSEASREASFCARTIVQGDGLLIVPDTHADAQWRDNPMVTGGPGLRFYAGAALITDEGHAVGSLCVADNRAPRRLDEGKIESLRALARQTVAHLRLRERAAELTRANEELQRIATRDPLTHLANRTLLEETIALELRRRLRSRAVLGLLFCDVDRFKQINDTFGHRAGDRVLVAVAERLCGAARAGDLVARFAGDEFVMLCPDLAAEKDVAEVADRVADRVCVPLTVHGSSLAPALSVGLSLARDDDTVESLIKRADEAMYEAKRKLHAATSVAIA